MGLAGGKDTYLDQAKEVGRVGAATNSFLVLRVPKEVEAAQSKAASAASEDEHNWSKCGSTVAAV
jgi:hypothetical protein